MPSCLVYFATSEGQTQKIADELARHLRERGVEVTVVEAPAAVDLAEYDAVVIGDSVHITHFHRPMIAFIREHREQLAAVPSTMFAVCLGIASKNEEDRERARSVLTNMLDETGWHPEHTAIFGGALKYTEYGFLVRFIMKRIAAHEGLATDTSQDYEYTDWASVAEFAGRFADELLAAGSRRPEA